MNNFSPLDTECCFIQVLNFYEHSLFLLDVCNFFSLNYLFANILFVLIQSFYISQLFKLKFFRLSNKKLSVSDSRISKRIEIFSCTFQDHFLFAKRVSHDFLVDFLIHFSFLFSKTRQENRSSIHNRRRQTIIHD